MRSSSVRVGAVLCVLSCSRMMPSVCPYMATLTHEQRHHQQMQNEDGAMRMQLLEHDAHARKVRSDNRGFVVQHKNKHSGHRPCLVRLCGESTHAKVKLEGFEPSSSRMGRSSIELQRCETCMHTPSKEFYTLVRMNKGWEGRTDIAIAYKLNCP